MIRFFSLFFILIFISTANAGISSREIRLSNLDLEKIDIMSMDILEINILYNDLFFEQDELDEDSRQAKKNKKKLYKLLLNKKILTKKRFEFIRSTLINKSKKQDSQVKQIQNKDPYTVMSVLSKPFEELDHQQQYMYNDFRLSIKKIIKQSNQRVLRNY